MPILQAPMAGACPPELAVAVAEAGGMGAAGVVLDDPGRIAEWTRRFRAGSAGPVQLNIWIPDPPSDDRTRVDAAAAFLSRFGTPAPAGSPSPEFGEQCEAMLAARPTVISSIMGLFEPGYVRRLHEQGIAWFATATSLDEALARRTPAPTRSSPRVWRQEATVAASTRTPPNGSPSGSSRCSPGSPTT